MNYIIRAQVKKNGKVGLCVWHTIQDDSAENAFGGRAPLLPAHTGEGSPDFLAGLKGGRSIGKGERKGKTRGGKGRRRKWEGRGKGDEL